MAVVEETPLMMPVSSTVIPNDFMWIVMKENNDPIPTIEKTGKLLILSKNNTQHIVDGRIPAKRMKVRILIGIKSRCFKS